MQIVHFISVQCFRNSNNPRCILNATAFTLILSFLHIIVACFRMEDDSIPKEVVDKLISFNNSLGDLEKCLEPFLSTQYEENEKVFFNF